MTYTPTTWKTGDVVTSAKLNNIEQGIANCSVLSCEPIRITVNYDGDSTLTANKTYTEINSEVYSKTEMYIEGVGYVYARGLIPCVLEYIEEGETPYIYNTFITMMAESDANTSNAFVIAQGITWGLDQSNYYSLVAYCNGIEIYDHQAEHVVKFFGD